MAESRRLSLRHWVRAPLWGRLLSLYVAGRLVTLLLMLAAAEISGPTSRFGPNASIGSFIVGWDAQWYWTIALTGYPQTLPLTYEGFVNENAWAFMPVYPYLAQALGFLAGFWGVGAVIVSLAAGFGAMWMLYALVQRRVGASAALWAAAFFSFGPLAALCMVGYAETLFLFLLLLMLLLITQRRYAWLYALIPLTAFTRPGILAFALFLGLYGIWRWLRRTKEPLARSEYVHIISLGALSSVTGFAWQWIAGRVTGQADAYLQTELSWRRSWLGGEGGFIPFDGWVQAAMFWFRLWGLPEALGIVALVVLVVGGAWVMWRSHSVRKMGMEVRLWSISYAIYLLAVFFPQSSTFRLLLPFTPLAGAVAVRASRRGRVVVLASCIAAQACWIVVMYGFANQFWQVP